MELDEMLAEPHGILGVVRAGEFDWKGAESEFHRAMELGPDVWDVWYQYAMFYLLPLRRLDGANRLKKVEGKWLMAAYDARGPCQKGSGE